MNLEKIKTWVRDRYNKTFLLVFIFAISIRIYYFILTKNQPGWWDEMEYASTALHWATGILYSVNPQRPPLLPFLEAIIFKLGGGEALVRFLIVFIPSVLIILFSYLIVKRMYNAKIALISSIVMAVFWEMLFNLGRLHVETLLLLFTYLSVYSFWRGYVGGEKKIYTWLVGIFLALAFLTKYTAVLLGFTFLIFLIVTERLKFTKDKNLWIALLVLVISLVPYFIWSYVNFKTFFSFLTAANISSSAMAAKPPLLTSINQLFGYIPYFTDKLFFIFLIIGVLASYKLVICFDLMLKKRDNETYSDFFNILFIIVYISFFIFILGSADDRWILPILLPLTIFISKGFLAIHSFIKRYSKHVAIIVIILLVLVGSYEQLKHADSIIKIKKDTYGEVKEAALWMKENSQENDAIFTISYPQTVYYSQRPVYTYSTFNATVLEYKIEELKPKFLTVSVFEPHPEFIFSYADVHRDRFKPVQAYFADVEQKQVLLVIYEISY